MQVEVQEEHVVENAEEMVVEEELEIEELKNSQEGKDK